MMISVKYNHAAGGKNNKKKPSSISYAAIITVVMAILFSGYTVFLFKHSFYGYLSLLFSSVISVILFSYYYKNITHDKDPGIYSYMISVFSSFVATMVTSDILSSRFETPSYMPYVTFLIFLFLFSILLLEFAEQHMLYGKKSLAILAYVSIAFIIFFSLFSFIIYDISYEKGRNDLLPSIIEYMDMYQKQFEVVMGVDDTVLNISSIIGNNYSSTRSMDIIRTIRIVNTRSDEKNYSFDAVMRTGIGNHTDITISNSTDSFILHDSSNTSYYYAYSNTIPPHGIQSYTVTFHFHKAPEGTWKPVCCGGNTIQMGGALFSIVSQ